MKWLFCLVLLSLPATTLARTKGDPSPRTVFRAHDSNGRLAHTKITNLGATRVQRTRYAIYYLEFVNPVSRHGMQQIAIIRNGRHFMGSYLCTLGPDDAELTIGKDRITVRVRAPDGRVTTDPRLISVIRFDARGPTRNRFFCGEGSGWLDGI